MKTDNIENAQSLLLLNNIKKLCSEQNISIPKLEKELGFGYEAIYNWKKHSPSADKVAAVATYFKVPVLQLLKGEAHKPSVKKPISRLDANDSRLLKKEFLRLIRNRSSIIRTLCDSDLAAVKLAEAAASRKDDDFEADIEALLWKYVAISLESQKGK